MSKLLYHWDSVQFALALENYDITVHQPHPPGYFLYVMLGRFINLFVQDANTTFVSMSILFSGLAVVTIYFLGKEIFDKRTSILAALIALTSPNLWFHGEVALTYVVEACFSSLVALLCWRILKGEHKYLWLSVIVLGIAGGIRQNTVVFLLPLWLFSVKGIPFSKILMSLGLLGVVCLLWFVPMVWMTGGRTAYQNAFRELWLFNTGHVSVFEKGWGSFQIFSTALANFVLYGVGAGIFMLGIATYSLIRHRKLRLLDSNKIFFFLLWIIPSVLFYLLIFIHPANPGYVLIFLPALLLLTAAAIGFISNDLKPLMKKDLALVFLSVIIVVNTTMFFFYHYVSYREIRIHDHNLSIMFDGIKTFNPENTVIFTYADIFFSYRHVMYYLPEYRVYQPELRITGGLRKTFWCQKRQTFVTDVITLPEEIKSFGILLIAEDNKNTQPIQQLSIREVLPFIKIAVGPIEQLQEVYPYLTIQSQKSSKDAML
jgi:hypothetical protein